MKALFATLISVVFISNVLGQSHATKNNVRTVEGLSKDVHNIFHDLQLPGIAIVVMKGEEIIHDQAIGYANLETQEVLTTDHLFWTASVTKPFTAGTYLKAEANGSIDLDDSIISYGIDRFLLPARANKNITLRHLITQTSESSRPGEHFVYSFRYNWLIAPFDGQKGYEAALKKELLDFLCIDGLIAGYRNVKDSTTRLVTPHRFNQESKSFEPSLGDRWEDVIPATNLLATPKALARAGQAFNKGIGLPEEQSALLNGYLDNDSIQDDTYGYGSFVNTIYGKKIIWQYGYGGAESALFIRVPSDNISIAILSNAADLSGVTRLGSGDLLKHPLADALFRYVILADYNLEHSLEWDAPTASIEKSLRKRGSEKFDLDAHALLSRALLNYLKPIPNKKRSAELLKIAAKLYPNFLKQESEPVLWLMVQHAAQNYTPFVESQIEQALQRNPNHPWFIGLAADFYAAIGDTLMAEKYYKKNIDNIHFREHSNISDAYLSIAFGLEETNPEKAKDFAWKALDMASWSFSWNRNQEARDLLTRISRNSNKNSKKD